MCSDNVNDTNVEEYAKRGTFFITTYTILGLLNVYVASNIGERINFIVFNFMLIYLCGKCNSVMDIDVGEEKKVGIAVEEDNMISICIIANEIQLYRYWSNEMTAIYA